MASWNPAAARLSVTAFFAARFQRLAPPPRLLQEAVAPGPVAELLLYAADRAQHVDQVIRPALERGDWVLSDRFAGSTLAYQGYGRELNRELIVQLEQIATTGLQPDATFLLDLPLAVSQSRRADQANDRIEAAGQAFLERVSEGFRVLAAGRGWWCIDADQVPDAVTAQIRDRLQRGFSQGG